MAKRHTFSARNVLTAEDMNSLVQTCQISENLISKDADIESNDKLIPNIKLLNSVNDSLQAQINTKANAATAVKTDFVDINGAKNYIGKNVGTISLSSGTHIFTNCTGTITGFGSAKVFIVNSPGLSFNDILKTETNWRNIYRDGRANYVPRSSYPIIITSDTIIGRGFNIGDSVKINFFTYDTGNTNYYMRKTRLSGQGIILFDYTNTSIFVYVYYNYNTGNVEATIKSPNIRQVQVSELEFERFIGD